MLSRVTRSAAPAASTLLALLLAGSAFGQSVNLIESEIERVRRSTFQLGPLYVTPSLQFSTGYDSNALSTSTAASDVVARVGPTARVAVPFGDIAFLDIAQEVDYVYYREQVELRRWFDVTRLAGGFGGRRILFKATDEFHDETGRPTSEFDFPVRQRTNELEASLAFALGWRHVLRLGGGQSRFEILEGLDDPTVTARLNQVRDRGFLDFNRKLTAKTTAIAEGFFERLRFDDPTRDGESYGARFGFEFSPSGGDPLVTPSIAGSFVNGRFLLGFRKVTPYDTMRVDYTGLIGSADVTFGFGEGQRINLLYSRDAIPSIFDENWYFIENRWGAGFTYQMTQRFSVTPGVVIGQNRYPLPGDTADGVEKIYDDHTTFRLAFDYRITESWVVGISSDYLKRDSNVSAFTKDRLLVGFNMRYQP